MQRKKIALLLILVMVLTIFQGCSLKDDPVNNQKNDQKKGQTNTSENQSDDKPTEMGRFIEKDISLPEMKEGETVIKILQNSNGQIELYTHDNGKYLCYKLKDDMSWESSESGWLNDGKLNKNTELDVLCVGEDGNYYACYANYSKDAKSHIIKSEDGGKTAQEIKIPYLEEGQTKDDYTSYPMIRNMDVLKNGNMVLYDLQAGNYLLIFSPEGEKLDKISIAEQEDMAYYMATGNDIIMAADDNKSILFYNTSSKKEDRSVEYDVKQGSMTFAKKSDGTLLMGNAAGIQRLTKDGTLWEITVDGALNSMSMPSIYFDQLFVVDGEEEQYYASYHNNDGSYQLKQYVFDKNVSAVPAHEITVYSLQENNTIRQAISLFQAKNTDVKVNYIVAMGEEGGTVSDYIRALNTELLAGNGADILLLDGLPVDSYLEKGVLADLSDIIIPLEDSGKILSNISESFHMDEKIYQIPVRFGVPTVLGKKDALSSMKSMDSIINYMQMNQGVPYSNSMTYRVLLQNYLALYSKDLYKNGELNQEQLVTFLDNLKQISDNIKATEYDEENQYSDDSAGDFINSDFLFRGSFLGLLNSKYSCAMTQITSIDAMIIPAAIVKSEGLGLSSINGMYLPKGMIGLNSASKESDISKKFIDFLYSEEVQNTDLYDGFPMNINSLTKWIAEESDSTFGAGDNEGNYVDGTWPSKEEREDYLKVIQGLTTPIEINQVISSIIIDETLPFFTGEIDAEQAAAAAESKINTYQSE